MQMQMPTGGCIAPKTGTIDHNDWDLREPARCGLSSIATIKAPVPGGFITGKTCVRHYEIVRLIVTAQAEALSGSSRLPGALPPARNHGVLATVRH